MSDRVQVRIDLERVKGRMSERAGKSFPQSRELAESFLAFMGFTKLADGWYPGRRAYHSWSRAKSSSAGNPLRNRTTTRSSYAGAAEALPLPLLCWLLSAAVFT